MNSGHPDGLELTAHKAWAAALVSVILYVLHGIITGEWTSVSALAPALTVLVMPVAVWAVPNRTAR